MPCCMACEILVPWPGIKPVCLHWQCRVLTMGPPGKSLVLLLGLDLGCVTMVKHTKKVGIMGKYGTRYGASLRKMVKKIEISRHAKYTCSFCGKTKMKRWAVGIWHCGSCMKTAQKHRLCCHSEVCHQKTEGIEGPVEAPPFDNVASL